MMQKEKKEEKQRGREDDGFSWWMTSCSERAVDLQTGKFAYMLGWHHDAEHTGAK